LTQCNEIEKCNLKIVDGIGKFQKCRYKFATYAATTPGKPSGSTSCRIEGRKFYFRMYRTLLALGKEGRE